MKSLQVLIILLLFFKSHGQQNTQEKAERFLAKNEFLNTLEKERFFVHTSKSTYFSGEKIWLKAYVLNDASGKPNQLTTNLHINLYGPNKTLIESKTFYTQKGMASGYIELSKDLNSGDYYLGLDTNWNRNFKKETLTKIQIVNLNKPESEQVTTNTLAKTKETSSINTSLYPESGKLLDGILNTMIIKSASNNNSQEIEGVIVENETGKEVNRFKIKSNGLGKASLFADYKKNYSAVINHPNNKETIKLPAPIKKGFVLSKNKFTKNKNVVGFSLKTNKKTVKNLENETIYAVLHRTGTIMALAPVTLKKNHITYTINFKKEALNNGNNTVTLFNEKNEVLSERNFFWSENKTIDVGITKASQTKDSIILNLDLLNKMKDANVSISVLYEDTKVLNKEDNIIKEFVYPTTLKTIPEISNNYNAEDLDLLVQTQPYKSTLKSIKKENIIYNFEKGIDIKGSINTKIKDVSNFKVILSSRENGILLAKPLKEDKKFEFKNLHLKDSSNYDLALLNTKGQTKKAQFYIYNTSLKYKRNNTITVENTQTEKTEENIISKKEEKTEIVNTKKAYSYLPQIKDIEELDEVVIKADRIAREEKRKTEKLKKIKKENPYLGMSAGFATDYLIDEEKDHELSLLEYLEQLWEVKVFYKKGSPYLVNPRPSNLRKVANLNLYKVYFDGTPVEQVESGFDFAYLRVVDFELITVNKSGSGYGLNASGGVINLVSRKGVAKRPIKYSLAKRKKVNSGFVDSSIKYKNNVLNFPNLSSERFYGLLNWIPNYTIKPNTTNLLKIKNPQAGNIKIIINGFNEDGDLIYKEVNISNLNS